MNSSIIVGIVMSLLLSGCSVGDIFSKLATSDIEQGAKEEYTIQQIQSQKQAKIDRLKSEFPNSYVELKSVSENSNNVAWAYRKVDGVNKTRVVVEAMLPNPGKQVYELWLKGGVDGKTKVDLGAMQYNQTDDYSFDLTTNKDVSGLEQIIISKEAVFDDKIETVVMTGVFGMAEATQQE